VLRFSRGVIVQVQVQMIAQTHAGKVQNGAEVVQRQRRWCRGEKAGAGDCAGMQGCRGAEVERFIRGVCAGGDCASNAEV